MSPIIAARLKTFEPSDDAEARLPVALDQRDDRRGDLGGVGGDGGQEADRGLGQPDPRPDMVELVGEEARRRRA